MNKAAGVNIPHIPYKGSSESVMAMLGGESMRSSVDGAWRRRK
jgi:tripartite-type tricarboxylate transporter receptor subunit TctC